MSNQQQNAIANWGRNPRQAGDLRPGPTSMEFRFPDQEGDVTVYLQVLPHRNAPRESWAWSLWWEIGTFNNPVPDGGLLWVYRSMELVVENNHPWYTFWGPLTRTMLSSQQPPQNDPTRIPLGALSLQARRALEQIALNTPIYEANEKWNHQNWIYGVLQRAVRARVLSSRAMERVPSPTLPLP